MRIISLLMMAISSEAMANIGYQSTWGCTTFGFCADRMTTGMAESLIGIVIICLVMGCFYSVVRRRSDARPNSRKIMLNQKITLIEPQLLALERFFGGYRDRVVTLAQDLDDSKYVSFSCPPYEYVNKKCAHLSLTEVEVLIKDFNAVGQSEIQIPINSLSSDLVVIAT